MQPISKTLVQELVKLKQKKYRDTQQRYLVSGLNAVQGALESQRVNPQMVLIQQGRESYLDILPEEFSAPVYELEEKDFKRLSDEKTPQGIALVIEKPLMDLDEFQLRSSLLLYLQDINDPGNLGTIIRSAVWFGVDTILLSSGSVDPFQPKAVRASAGFITQMQIYEQVDIEELGRLTEKNKMQLAGTVVKSGTSLNEFKYSADSPLLLAFGSEAHGLSDDVLDLCRQHITIPKKGRGESLNLAISVALCLYGITL